MIRCTPIPDVPVRDSRTLVRRNLALECEILLQATRGVMDPTRLMGHCQARSQALSGEYVSDPMLIADGRDRWREGREEAADGVNHLLFWLQSPESFDEPDRREDALVAMRLFAMAYDRLGR